MSIKQALLKTEKDSYGSNYDSHYFEQYKMYVDMADRISNRRQIRKLVFSICKYSRNCYC